MEQTAPNSQNQNKEKNTLMAVVAYILFFIPLLTDAKDDPFVKYHVKQGLVLFICAAILMVIESIFIFSLFTPLFNLVIFIFIILGIINAAGGKTIPLPIIGKFADKFTF